MIPLVIVSAALEGLKDKREHYYTTKSCKGEESIDKASWVRIQFLHPQDCVSAMSAYIKDKMEILLVCVPFFHFSLYLAHGDVHLEEVVA